MPMLGSSRAYASSPEKILKMWCSLVCFEVCFDQIVYGKLTNFYIKHIFYIKHNAYIGTRLLWELATGEIFENMLQLKRFGS